ncbi:MAG: protein translocase subunit SecF [Treponema sp.]|jgi:preprotein translocase subunit SecF|nr:protein translocase subunit SecF [Treponema sp.]
MKSVISFSKFFFPAAVISIILILAGIVGFIFYEQRGEGGFNLGVDFQAGFIQEIQFAPTALSLSYSGPGNVSVSFDRNNLYIIVSGSGVEGVTHPFPYGTYQTIGELTAELRRKVEGIQVRVAAAESTRSQWLIQSAQGNPQLGSEPFVIHYLAPDAEAIPIEEVRSALLPLGEVSVQILGNPGERHFMIRIQDSEFEEAGAIPSERIIEILETRFGTGGVAIIRADYVGSRFSKNLTDQAGILLALTLILILIYASIRFKPQFALGAVLAIAHDALVMVAFITWTRMEFNTTTIAAILTILGYSINDTIVIFDRIRETRRIYPDDAFVNILDRALTETLGRTIITTATTMLAVLSLFVFTTGSMKDFALALLVGMVSGVYSTVFIASGFVNYWDAQAKKRAKKKLVGVPAVVAVSKA